MSRTEQSVAIVLAKVAEGKHVILIDRLDSNVALAAAVTAEAERRGMNVNVELVDDGVSAELATPPNE